MTRALARMAETIRAELPDPERVKPMRLGVIVAAATDRHLPEPDACVMESALYAALAEVALILSPSASRPEVREARTVQALRHLLDLEKLVTVARAKGAEPVPYWVE